MNFSDPRFWLDVVVLFAAVINTAVTWLRKPGQEAIDRVTALQAHVDEKHRGVLGDVSTLRNDVDERHQETAMQLAVLSERMEHMPTNEELAQLAGSVRVMSEAQERMSMQLSRIETYLLNNK